MREDLGYTLVELMIVLGLLGVILTTVFMSLQVLGSSSNVARRDAWASSSTGDSLVYLERTISQATSITATSSGTRLQFVIPRDLSGVNEQHVIEASGGRLTDSVSVVTTGAPGPVVVRTIIQGSATQDLPSVVSTGTPPLFVYLPSGSPSSARSIRLTVSIRYQGQLFTDGRQVFLRNR